MGGLEVGAALDVDDVSAEPYLEALDLDAACLGQAEVRFDGQRFEDAEGLVRDAEVVVERHGRSGSRRGTPAALDQLW